MKTPNKSKQRRKTSGCPRDVLNWHSLYGNDKENYKELLDQDALFIHEAVCLIYPKSPDKFKKKTSEEDDGRMDYIVRMINDSVATADLKIVINSGETLNKSVDLLDWARRRNHIEKRLGKWIHFFFRKNKKMYTGRSIPAL